MNFRIVIKVLGLELIILSACMIPTMIVGIIYRDDNALSAVSITGMLMLFIGLIARQMPLKSTSLKTREGFLIVSMTWVMASFFCALPYVISGAIPDIAGAIFEATSGITTTGSSILTDIEIVPKTILFWRSFTHWMGGLGILTMAIAVLPALGIGGFQMAKAESPGTAIDKITPKIADMAKLLYTLYFVLTVLQTILLLFGGMDLFNALCFSFSSISTGGFANFNSSVSGFNSLYIEIILVIFMIIGALNFTLLYDALFNRKLRNFYRNSEFRFYMGLLFFSALFISLNLTFSGTIDNFGESFKEAVFQAVSIATTTGFTTVNYDLWPNFSRLILFLLLFVGGCSGSTAGGIKTIRLLIIAKFVKREFKQKLHTRAVISTKLKGESIHSDTAVSALIFVALYILIFFFGALVLTIDGVDLVTALSASAASIGNVGPGLSMVGPVLNYSFFSDSIKLFLAFLMIVGKLEIYTIIFLFWPAFWNPDKIK